MKIQKQDCYVLWLLLCWKEKIKINKIYGYDTNIYETSIGNISNSGLRIYEGNVSTSTGKVVVNGVEVTDIESWNKALDTFTNLEQKIKEKDKEIEKLTAESTEWESKCYKYQNIIDELEKYLYNEYLEWKDSENQSLIDKAFENKEIYDYLKELKEGK